MSFCPTQTEDALLSVGHFEGSPFSEARSILQHLHGLILRHFAPPMHSTPNYLLRKLSKSKHSIKIYLFFFFSPQRTAKESLYLFRKNFWLKHLEVKQPYQEGPEHVVKYLVNKAEPGRPQNPLSHTITSEDA